MANKPTYPTVAGNAVYSAATLNAIFDDLATAIQACLGRGGTSESPNSMLGDLDMDLHKIINLSWPNFDRDAASKEYVDQLIQQAAIGDVNIIEGGTVSSTPLPGYAVDWDAVSHDPSLQRIPFWEDLPYVDARTYGFSTENTPQENSDVWDAMGVAGVHKIIFRELYPMASMELWSDLEATGDGPGTGVFFDQQVVFDCMFCENPTADPADNLKNIYIHDMLIKGSSDTSDNGTAYPAYPGFAEFNHTVSLNGVTNVTFERVTIEGFRGDGILIGSGNRDGALPTPPELHNYDVTIKDCIFDGLNNNNRNGISIIDGTRVLIDNCKFFNVSLPNYAMPGPIDIEPDANAFHIINDIKVRSCYIDPSCYGFLGGIGLHLPQAVAFTSPAQNISIMDNTILGGVGLTIQAHAVNAAHKHNIRIVGNLIDCQGVGRAVNFYAGQDMIVANNKFKNAGGSGWIGYIDQPTYQIVRNATFIGNRFDKLGATLENSIQIYNATNLVLKANTFTDCYNAVLYLGDTGVTNGVHIEGNTFLDSAGVTTSMVSTDPGHTTTQSKNRFESNTEDGNCGGFDFPYYKSHFFSLVSTIDQEIPSDVSYPLVFGTEEWDLSDVTGSATFTAPTNGIYTFSGVAQLSSSVAGGVAFLELHVDASPVRYGPIASSGGTGQLGVGLHTNIVLSAGQTVNLHIKHDFGSPVNAQSGLSRFSGYKVEQ